MLKGCVSFVQAAQDFFSEDGGRKIEVSEFKELTPEDRSDLHTELGKVGYDLRPLKTAEPVAA